MKILELKPGQPVKINKRDYKYEGVKKVKGVIGKVQKIVFQGTLPEDQILYSLTDGSKSLENENILIGKII